MSAPLENIKVLDLTHMLAGPYASMLIADLGAEVVKVEPPGKGEITRGLYKDHADYSLDGVSPYHITLARNKNCLLYTSPSPRDVGISRMPSSA